MSTFRATRLQYFNPTQISGCQLWLDGQDPNGNGTTPTNGATISTWVDKSGNARNASAGGTSPTYTLSSRGITFGGAGYMNTSYSASLSVESLFVVFNCPSLTNFQQLLGSQLNGRQMFFGSAGKIYVKVTGTANELINSPNSTISNGVTAMIEYIHDGTTPVLYSNGSLSVTGTNYAFTAGKTSVLAAYDAGGGYFDPYTGSMFEIIGYYSAVTTSQRQQIEGYLAWKWGLQASLPNSHPYRFVNVYPNPSIPFSPVVPRATNVPLFDPRSIPGCVCWIDTADRTRFAFSGSSVSGYTEKVSNVSYNAVGTTLSLTTINGVQSLNFPGTSYLLGTLPNQTTGYIFIVVQANSSANAGFFPFVNWHPINNNNAYVAFGYAGNNTSVGPYVSNNGAGSPLTTVSTVNNYIFAFAWNSTITSVGVNGGTPTAGTQPALSPAAGVSTFYIGFDQINTTTMNFGECIVYNTSTLSTLQRQQIEGYLAWKWGLTASLPNGHPYKTPPIVPIPYAVRRAVQTRWSPLNIPGLAIWLDGLDPNANGIPPVGGSAINVWRDKSGNGRNASAGSAPIFVANQGIYFSRGPYLLGSNFANTSTGANFFVVGTDANLSGRQRFAMVITSNGYGAQIDNSAYGPMTAGTYYSASPAVSANIRYIMSGNVLTGGTIVASLNGTNTTSFSSFGGNANRFEIGGDATSAAQLEGYVHEVIYYDAVFTVAQKQLVEGYLAWKWGIQGSLPAGHPYKNIPPAP